MKTWIYLNRAWCVIVFLCIVPVLLWLQYHGLDGFSSTGAWLHSTGQILGLIGTVLFSLNFILATRLSLIEDAFGGLNRVYIAHHLLGAYAFIALIFHPLALGFQYIFVSWSLVLPFFLPDFTKTNLPVWYGIIAFASLCILLWLTFYGKLLYETWKLTHKFLGASLFFASLHVYFIPSTTSYSLPMRIYMLAIVGVGLASFVYTTLLHKWFAHKYVYVLTDIVSHKDDTLEIIMKPKTTGMPYRPGQFAFFSVKELGVSIEEHPFSLMSSPGQELVSIGVKALGDYTETLKLLKVGAEATIEGPYGYFSYDRYSNPKQIWIAGGIGITPFIGMARSLTVNTPFLIELWYCIHDEQEAAFVAELQAVQAQVPGFRLVEYCSVSGGRISAEIIAHATVDFASRDIFICGPPPMMASMKADFRKLGKKGSEIHTEEFAMM